MIPVVLLCAVSSVRGEEVTPKMPRGLPLPREVKIDKKIGIPWVWVAWKGFVPRELPGDNQREVTTAKPLAFMEPCYTVASEELAGGTYLFLVKSRDGKTASDYLGWVNERHVVRRPEADRNLGTSVYEKVMLVNTVESIQEKKTVEHVPVLLGPSPSAETTKEPLRLSNILFVYGDTNRRNPKDGYVLIGTDPNFNEEKAKEKPDEAARVVLGWVPKNRTCRWNTREALEWDVAATLPAAKDRRKTPGRIYRGIDDALAALQGKDAPAWFVETFDDDGVSIPFPHDRSRYPILDLEYKDEVLPELRLGDNVLRRVGVVGGFVDSKGVERVSLEKIEDLKRRLHLLQQQVSQTEILFVIDDTESMDAWFPVVARTADRILADARKDPDSKVRIAITYYNDTPDGKNLEKAVQARKLVDARSQAGTDMIEELRKHKVNAGYDPREQVFLGITRGIEEAGFQMFSRKIVVVLGDMADHADENDPKHPGETKIADHLVPKGAAPIEFYAVQVIDPDSRDDAAAFRKQMQTILDLFRQRVGDKTRGGYVTSGKENVVRQHILDRFNHLKEEAAGMKQTLVRLQQGLLDNTQIGPELEKMLRTVGANVEELRKLKGFQVFRDGYVWAKSREGAGLTRVSLLLSGGELDTYLEALKRLEKGKKVRELLADAVRTQIGEQKDTKKFEDDLELARRGLHAQSWLLRKVLGDIPEEDTLVYLQEMQKVRLRINKLRDVRNEKAYVYRPREVTHPAGLKYTTWDRGEELPFAPRRFYIGSDEEVAWYWIDFVEEWP